MRRLAGHLVAVCVALAFVAGATLGPATAALAVSVGQGGISHGGVRQGLDDFTFDSWHSDFRLGVSADGRSTLSTTETIVARFPDFDQNRGIRRAIPTHYRGHPTDLTLENVTDGDGRPRAYETDTQTDDNGDEFLVVTIAADGFVRGVQTYLISYRQANVTLFPTDSPDEEFYWEVNGTGWAQPFGDVSATLLVAPELVPKLTGRTTCFQGGEFSGASCATLTSEADGDAWRVEVGAGGLGPREGLTMVVGFQAGTFVPRDDSFTANPFPSIGLVGALLGVLGVILAAAARLFRWRSAPGRPTIIAEYLPPKAINLLQAGDVSGAAGRAMAAQFISFAVRGNVRVLEAAGRKHYLLELRHADQVDEAEHRILGLLFPGLQPGTRRDLKATDPKLSLALQKELRSARKRMLAERFRETTGGRARFGLAVLAVATGIVSVGASAIAIGAEVGGAWPVLVLGVGALSSTAIIALTASVRPLTAAGSELRDYLKGVRLYIGLAEADRLRVLQSPEGALRSPYRPDRAAPSADPAAEPANAPLQVLKLYERLLPFAVLFGQEKDWARVLGEYYSRSGAQPEWYSGRGAFSAAYFASGIGSFASTTSASWSGSASSSSGSGAGGGSVGGGGGGGGGGGV